MRIGLPHGENPREIPVVSLCVVGVCVCVCVCIIKSGIMVDITPGLRVVRGPDWEKEDEDGGEGYVGTVITGGGTSGDDGGRHDLATVQWDVGGERRVYRCGGAEAKYDLRVIDSAPAGIVHRHRECSGCESESIAGCMWKCIHCLQYNLCTPCYMENRHSVWHHFMRIDSPENPGQRTRVECRYTTSSHIQARGMFVGATVVRGRDWRWGDQDGGEGKEGTVIEITGWQTESSRSVAVVQWRESGMKKKYRLGHKGKVDLQCTKAVEGGHCYLDHLPILGSEYKPPSVPLICAGDRAKIEMDLDLLKAAQDKSGKWTDNIPLFIGNVGLVIDVSLDEKIAVIIFDISAVKFSIITEALKKIEGPELLPGDVVRVIDDIAEVHRIQKEGRGWEDDMVLALGQLGRMPLLLEDGNAVVVVNGRRWIMDSLCLTPAPGEQPDHEETEQEVEPSVDVLLYSMMNEPSPDLIEAVAKKGHTKMLRGFLEKHPDKLNAQYDGGTLLHLAAIEGRLNVVRLLLELKADITATAPMRNGSVPLHSAVLFNQYQVVKILLEAGSDVNLKNNNGNTAVHMASGLGFSRVLQLLIQHPKCDINIQNEEGDIPLHLACLSNFPSTIKMLVEAGADVTMFNLMAATALHHCVNNGFDLGVHTILEWHPEVVNCTKIDDGSTPLHIAAYTGNPDATSYLASLETCDLDSKTYTGMTPLFLACKAGNTMGIEYLVGYGADVTTVDDHGSTPLHFVMAKKEMKPLSKLTPYLNKFHEFVCSSDNSIQDVPAYITVACFLVSEGADLEIRTPDGYIPFGFCPSQYRPLLTLFARPERRGSYKGSLPRHPPPAPKSISTQVAEPLASNTKTSGEATNSTSSSASTTSDTNTRTTKSKSEAARVSPTQQMSSSPDGAGVSSHHKSTSSNPPSNTTGHTMAQNDMSGAGCFLCEGPCDITFRPCGHRAMCSECSDRIKRCPTCQNDVLQKIKISI